MAKQHVKRFALFPQLAQKAQNLEDSQREQEGKAPRKRNGYTPQEIHQLERQKELESMGPLHGPFLPLCWRRHSMWLRWQPGYRQLGYLSNLRCAMCSPLPEELMTQSEWREKFGHKLVKGPGKKSGRQQ